MNYEGSMANSQVVQKGQIISWKAGEEVRVGLLVLSIKTIVYLEGGILKLVSSTCKKFDNHVILRDFLDVPNPLFKSVQKIGDQPILPREIFEENRRQFDAIMRATQIRQTA